MPATTGGFVMPTSGFGFGFGLPNDDLWNSPDDLTTHERAFVGTLRPFAAAAAEHCLTDSPAQYDDFINDLIDVDPGDAPTKWTVRLAHLLMSYASHFPSPDCQFLDTTVAGTHAWLSPDGWVVADIVTTLALSELSPFEDQSLVMEVLQAGRSLLRDRFVGVRLVVLDAPHESSFYTPNGAGQPLLTCDLSESNPDNSDPVGPDAARAGLSATDVVEGVRTR